MQLNTTDWLFIFLFFLFSLGIGLGLARKAGKNTKEFFLSGRNMPWWLLGISMVATTFSADTPNLVTDIVRKNGVAGNWVWWAFLLTGMLTVFIYAKLWRRSGVMTDLEFYELRYGGKGAAFLRGFRALYLGVFFNVVIMATVCLAAIKIGGTLLGLSPGNTILLASIITVLYSGLGGLRGVIWTDLFQFIIAMTGSIWAAIYIIDMPEVGGLNQLLIHSDVIDKLKLLPDFSDPASFIPLLIIPLAVQWWSVWYPGAEPGGGGYIAQRMLAAKDENNAMGATFLFNIAHYALRPWPWILIALASLVVFPDLQSLQQAFPDVASHVVQDDMAYPAMLSYLPHGLLGLVIASLLGAFMSTLSTHLNWGSSYIVNDWYLRFLRPQASEKEGVWIGRISTLLLMVIAALLALYLQNALQAFQILLQIGAGTGLIFILRWFWWRVNVYSEITGMVVSFLIALYFEMFYTGDLAAHWRLCLGVFITSLSWIIVTLLTPPEKIDVLVDFYQKTKPASLGWQPVIQQGIKRGTLLPADEEPGQLPLQIGMMFLSCVLAYSFLFTTGNWIYGHYLWAVLGTVLVVVSAIILIYFWRKMKVNVFSTS